MSGAHEALEHAEHASHSGHGGHSSGKLMGLTMALIGVLIAFSAAMVGGERNELTKTMIEQTQAHADYTSASTKFRLIMLEIEKQRQYVGTTEADSPGKKAVLERFLRLYLDYSKERKISKLWAESYAPMITAHFEATEGFERAQLIAEIGIVLASLGVLLASRGSWFTSIALAVACLAQLGMTNMRTKAAVHAAEAKVSHAEEAFQELRKAHVAANDDEKAVDQLDPGGVIRAAIEAKIHAADEAAPAAEKH